MNRASRIAGGGALFVAGVLVGLALRREVPEPRSRTLTETSRPKPDAEAGRQPETPNSAPATAPTEPLIGGLEADRQTARRDSTRPDPEGLAISPEELFKVFLEFGRDLHLDPERLRLLCAGLGQLSEKSAGYFIEHFSKPKGPGADEERKVAMELALASGGPRATEFVSTLLHDPLLEPSLRNKLLSELSGSGDGFVSIRRLPISESLGATAMTMCRLENPEERRAGAGLLGNLRSDTARLELRRLIEEDQDIDVRTTAVRSLGHVGDPSIRTYLERLLTSPGASALPPRFVEAVSNAIKELSDGSR